MRLIRLALLIAVVPTVARAQLAFGLGGGAGIGSRGGDAKGTHIEGFAEFKLPVFPGLRVDLLGMDAPSDAGKVSAALSIVFSAPIPVVTPYVLGGWGNYGIDGDNSRSGWNIGLGVKAALPVGVRGVSGIFLDVRRHQRVARDLLTIGVRF